MNNVQEKTINAIRFLSAEAIQKANSGHPGLPLGAAPTAYTLFSRFLKFNSKNPKFENRDRFILSAGHGSMLNYSLLYLFGYGLTIEDLKSFRQKGSKTPGHPEYGHTLGVETTTGPLGQGIANAVGMAIAEEYLAKRFNRPNYDVVDHYTYALAGDGCMMEGIEYEAASLAGTLKLGKLIVFYDDNEITIEGNTNVAFDEDVAKRHKAQGWQVIDVKDGNNVEAIAKAVKKAQAEKNKPSLIVVHTTIGYGSPLAGKADCHGAPLGKDNIVKMREYFGWNYGEFEVPEDVLTHTSEIAKKGEETENAWNNLFASYEKEYPELAKEYKAFMSNEMPSLADIEDLWDFPKADATRGTSATVLNKLAELVPNLIGGSADLAPSNKSNMKKRGDFTATDRSGSNMHFGIREHAMAAICNGMALHGGLRVYCATFFVFSDYMKNAMRLSALMNLPVTYILTHDSIGVGEDGPTHQPVEQLVTLRSIPNMKVVRPCDGKETTAAWTMALNGEGPTCLVLSRQTLPIQENSGKNALKGGYILKDCEGAPDALLLSSGSEVDVIVKAQAILKEKGINARVISMPCMEVFEKQSKEYKESVIPSSVRARVAVEAGSSNSWYKYVGLDGATVCMDTFGASAPAEELFPLFGFTAENVAEKTIAIIKK